MRRGYLGPLTPLIGLLVMVAGTGVALAQQTQTVGLTEFAFGPAALNASVGQSVSWTFKNNGQFPHDF